MTPSKVKPAKKNNSQKGKVYKKRTTPRKVKPAKKKHNSQKGKVYKETRHPER